MTSYFQFWFLENGVYFTVRGHKVNSDTTHRPIHVWRDGCWETFAVYLLDNLFQQSCNFQNPRQNPILQHFFFFFFFFWGGGGGWGEGVWSGVSHGHLANRIPKRLVMDLIQSIFYLVVVLHVWMLLIYLFIYLYDITGFRFSNFFQTYCMLRSTEMVQNC